MRVSPEKILEWVAANFQYKSRKNGKELTICNPFDGDTGYNFNINTMTGKAHDWRGDGWAAIGGGKFQKPTFIRFVQVYRNCTYMEALQEVLGKSMSLDTIRMLLVKERGQRDAGKTIPEETHSQIKLPEGSLRINESPERKIVSIVKKWLLSRGVTDELIDKYNIHHCGLTAVWPYYEYDDLVFWQSRNALEKIYLFPPESVGVTKSHFLFGFDQVEPGQYVIITEAIFGAMTLEDQCVASGGAIMGRYQVAKLKLLYPKKGVVFAPDNDLAGKQSIITNYELASGIKYPMYYSIPSKVQMPNGKFTKDWNEVGETIGFGKPVKDMFAANIKPLTSENLIKLRLECAQMVVDKARSL